MAAFSGSTPSVVVALGADNSRLGRNFGNVLLVCETDVSPYHLAFYFQQLRIGEVKEPVLLQFFEILSCWQGAEPITESENMALTDHLKSPNSGVAPARRVIETSCLKINRCQAKPEITQLSFVCGKPLSWFITATNLATGSVPKDGRPCKTSP